MKRLCILAAIAAITFCGYSAEAQQRGGSGKNAQSQSKEQGQEPQRGGGQKRGGGQGGGELFRLLDLDRDGNLSTREIDGAVAALMKLDTNKDGVLDAQELAVTAGGGGERGQQGDQGGGQDGRNNGSRNQSAKTGN